MVLFIVCAVRQRGSEVLSFDGANGDAVIQMDIDPSAGSEGKARSTGAKGRRGRKVGVAAVRKADKDLSERHDPVVRKRNSWTRRNRHQGEILAEKADVVRMTAGKFSGDAKPVTHAYTSGYESAAQAKTITSRRRCIGSERGITERY